MVGIWLSNTFFIGKHTLYYAHKNPPTSFLPLFAYWWTLRKLSNEKSHAPIINSSGVKFFISHFSFRFHQEKDKSVERRHLMAALSSSSVFISYILITQPLVYCLRKKCKIHYSIYCTKTCIISRDESLNSVDYITLIS